MFLWSTLKKTWTRLLRWQSHDARKESLALLCLEYIEERKSSLQLQRHAEQMRYPEFREKLLRIAGDEQKHAERLRERIITLGGKVSDISYAPEEGWNSWERLHLDLDAEKHCIWELEEQLVRAERIDPETAEGLSHTLEDEKKHREVILNMLMRSDPQAEWPV